LNHSAGVGMAITVGIRCRSDGTRMNVRFQFLEGIAIIAAGLLEKDGLAIVIGSLIGLSGAVYVVAVIGGVWAAFKAIFGL
jgi:hypothetical protein